MQNALRHMQPETEWLAKFSWIEQASLNAMEIVWSQQFWFQPFSSTKNTSLWKQPSFYTCREKLWGDIYKRLHCSKGNRNSTRCKLGMGQRSWYKSSFAVNVYIAKCVPCTHTSLLPHAVKDVTTITEQNFSSPKHFVLLLTHDIAVTCWNSFRMCK